MDERLDGRRLGLTGEQRVGLTLAEQAKYHCGLSVSALSDRLIISRQALSDFFNGKSGCSPDLAISLEQAFGWPAEEIMRAQAEYSLWVARRQRVTKVSPIPPRWTVEAD